MASSSCYEINSWSLAVKWRTKTSRLSHVHRNNDPSFKSFKCFPSASNLPDTLISEKSVPASRGENYSVMPLLHFPQVHKPELLPLFLGYSWSRPVRIFQYQERSSWYQSRARSPKHVKTKICKSCSGSNIVSEFSNSVREFRHTVHYLQNCNALKVHIYCNIERVQRQIRQSSEQWH